MKIKLLKLTLQNFKGIKNLTIDFSDVTNIHGANEAGKTTLFDAFTWLLFGKDSQDRKDFNIKNTKFPDLNRQDHLVEGVLILDGVETTIQRVYKEKWTKKKGFATSELTGNVQEFLWNGVPLQAGRFSQKVSEIADEVVFKLITNPLYFNSLNWTKRRDFLFKLAGDISNEEVALGKKDFELLLSTLQTKSLEEFKKEISARMKIIKDELEVIPARIDEVLKSQPEVLEWDKIEAEIKNQEHALADIDIQISDSSKANQAQNEAKSKRQNEIHGIKSQLKDIEHELENAHKNGSYEALSTYNNKLSELTNKFNSEAAELNSKELLLKSLQDKKQGLEVRKQSLLDLFKTTNERQFVTDLNSHVCCPNCNHEFNPNDADGSQLEERRKAFIANQNKSLDEIDAQGVELKKSIEECDLEIKEITSVIESLKTIVSQAENELVEFKKINKAPEQTGFDLASAVEDNKEYGKLLETLASLENAPVIDTNVNNNIELLENKTTVTKTIDTLKLLLRNKDLIENTEKRIVELKSREQDLSQQLADLEGVEFNINEFNKAKIDLVESRINGKFQYVKFKMFDFTIEGNPIETCETTYNGVPFSDLNTAHKVWSGIDIINTLSNHYNVSAPIFLDNRESVTEIPSTESQVINLFVSRGYKELEVA